jgi:outer membrane protein assembly factor BamA
MGGIRRVGRRHAAGAACALVILAFGGSSQESAPARPAVQETPARPIVRAVRVEGNQRYTADQLVAAFGQPLGAPLLSDTELRRGVEVLFDTFRVRAVVEYIALPGAAGEVELVLRIEELPMDLELRITGNVEISDDKVHEWAGVGEREELYLHQAPRIQARLLQRYREEGFYFVEVNVVERPADPATICCRTRGSCS